MMVKMRRVFLNISVSVLAFCLGVFAFYFFLPQKGAIEVPAKNVLAPVPRFQPDFRNTWPSRSEEDEPSDEQIARWQLDSFKPLIKRWLRGENLPAGEQVELERQDDYQGLPDLVATPELADFNVDGKKELTIETACSGDGNCEFFVFQKAGKNGYRILLRAEMVHWFQLLKNRTNGYFNLETRAHSSAFDGEGTIWKFNGKEYIKRKCFMYEYKAIAFVDIPAKTKYELSIYPDRCEGRGF